MSYHFNFFIKPKKLLIKILWVWLLLTPIFLPHHGFAKTPPPQGFADLLEPLLPAVVNISSTETKNIKEGGANVPPEIAEMLKQFGFEVPKNPERNIKRKITGLGSGFIISKDGLIVTNHHVVAGGTDIKVTLTNGKTYNAKLIGSDERSDLALLKINGRNLPFVQFGDSNKLRVGDWVIAIGNPAGLGGSVSAGIVSALGRNIHKTPYDNFIQTDAAINRGNSGGPLFDTNGRVVGINSIIFSFSQDGGSVGIGFAIPSNQAKMVIEQLQKYGSARRAWLGVALQEMDETLAKKFGMDPNDPKGALVVGVVKKSPANKSDIKVGDVILNFGNEVVKDSGSLPRLVASQDTKQTINVTIWRDEKTINTAVRLVELKSNEANQLDVKIAKGGKNIDELGLTLRDLTKKDRDELSLPGNFSGVMVSGVSRGSPAQTNSLYPSMIILTVNGRKTNNVDTALALITRGLNSRNKQLDLELFVPNTGFGRLEMNL